MSITLLCLVKGNTLANAFAVDIDSEKLVSHLKDAIKDKIDVPAGFKAKDLKLWNVTIPDDRDDLLSNLTLENNAELLATKKVSKYFPVSPAEEHIHVLVELPASTATSDEVLELRKQLASMQELLEEVTSLQALLNKSTHGTYK